MHVWRRTRGENNGAAKTPAPMSVYWPVTMGQRGKHQQQLPAKPHKEYDVGRRSVCGNMWVILLLGLLQREEAAEVVVFFS